MTDTLTQVEIDNLLGDLSIIDKNYPSLIDLNPIKLIKKQTTNYTFNKGDCSLHVKRKKTKKKCRYCKSEMKNTILYRQSKSINLLYCGNCDLAIINN